MLGIEAKTALVVGGSRGIGAACAEMLAQAGARVVVTYCNHREAASKVLRKIESLNQSGMILRCNVARPRDCERVARTVEDSFGCIDILVNSAGIWEYDPLPAVTPQRWNRSISTNLSGTFNMCRAVIPNMVRRRFGRIVNISSTAGQRGEAYHSPYAAAKGGIIALTKSMAVELIKSGIRVNCVAPGWVRTEMIGRVAKNPRELREVVSSIPRGCMATPEEIAGPVLFLSSDLAENIVGEVLNVNGGSVLCG